MYDPNMPTTFDYRDDERPNTRTAVAELGPSKEQAARIVKAWRATDQHDQLLAHYIRQAIDDNVSEAIKHFAATENELKVAKEFIAEQVGVEPEIEHEPKEID